MNVTPEGLRVFGFKAQAFTDSDARLKDWMRVRHTGVESNLVVRKTYGHVDGIACFVRPGVVLFEESAVASGPGYETTEANRRALEGQTDAEGRPIELIYIREAPPLKRQGQGDWGYCRSYVNFYIANGGVVMPCFGIPEDEAALEAVSAAFPDREVVQVDVSTVSQGGGGIHCITQQQPAV